MSKSRDIASRASTSIAGEGSGISLVCSLPRCRIVTANVAEGALRAAGCDTSFCSRVCAMPTEPGAGILPLTSAVWRRKLLWLRRKLMPSLEHVTLREPTVTPSRLAISSRLIPCPTNSLMFSIACGVNLNRLPLAEGLAFGVVMAAPSSRPVVVWDRCPVHWAAALITPCFGHTVQNRDTAFDALEGNVAYQQRWQDAERQV